MLSPSSILVYLWSFRTSCFPLLQFSTRLMRSLGLRLEVNRTSLIVWQFWKLYLLGRGIDWRTAAGWNFGSDGSINWSFCLSLRITWASLLFPSSHRCAATCRRVSWLSKQLLYVSQAQDCLLFRHLSVLKTWGFQWNSARKWRHYLQRLFVCGAC